ncbi:MAG: hypothetical protein KF760_17475 [Candidatus Eremiobacteraeota bacterium]|nr:hypothetical protein [Candidatus Eremiobacteraeota bacterium]MCW5866691.1 hypothetical protein [Candidatus Eremiobacteraeota bacterium]
MQAICTKCKGTGKVPAPVAPNQAPPKEPELIKCPACLGGGIIDTTAMA